MKKWISDALSCLLLISLAIQGCKKTDTVENSERFECLIEGKYWTYLQCDYCNKDALTAGPEEVDFKHYSIKATNKNFPNTGFEFFIDNDEMAKSDTINLGSFSNSYCSVYCPSPNIDYLVNSPEFLTTDNEIGKLVFTKKQRVKLKDSSK